MTTKTIIMASLALALTACALQPVFAMRTEIKATGRFSMSGDLNVYERNVLKVITEKCLEAKADKLTKVEVVVDGHGNVIDLNLSGSGLGAEASKKLVDDIRALKLGDSGNQAESLEIKLTFDLQELGGGPVTYGGTSLKVSGGRSGGASVVGGPGASLNAGPEPKQ
ncbi:MAG: hypothetical protein KGS72_17810 [Cyanobacteria bacterium REEB67]|nr:hypothetical protein [Cyanobacteria bacterium REEB67]